MYRVKSVKTYKNMYLMFLVAATISPLNDDKSYSMMYQDNTVGIIAIRSYRTF